MKRGPKRLGREHGLYELPSQRNYPDEEGTKVLGPCHQQARLGRQRNYPDEEGTKAYRYQMVSNPS